MITLNISKAVLLRAVEALRDQGALQSGLSFGEWYIAKEETQQWEDADALAAALREHGKAVALARETEAEALRNHPEMRT